MYQKYPNMVLWENTSPASNQHTPHPSHPQHPTRPSPWPPSHLMLEIHGLILEAPPGIRRDRAPEAAIVRSRVKQRAPRNGRK